MAKFQFVKGEESIILKVFIQDSTSTSGAGLGSLDESSNIVGGYVKRNGTGVALAVDEDVDTEGTYEAPSSAAQVRIGTPANMRTGVYELHFHDDLFTTADYVMISLGGASNMADLLIEVQLTTFDLNTSIPTIVGLVWDEILIGATHNISTSAGRRLRQLQESAGVYGGFIWIDTTANGTAGTTDYENGTSDNPVDNIDDANTLAGSVGISRFQVAPGSSIQFVAGQTNEMFFGREWTLDLNNQAITGTYIEGASVSGTGTGANPHFALCEFGATTLAGCRLGWCRFTDTITMSAASDYYFHDCYSGVAGAGTPVIDFGGGVANSNLSLRRYSGGINIANKDANGTDQMSLEGDGQLVVAASSSGAISVRGNFLVTNTGGASITYDDNTQGLVDVETDIAALPTATEIRDEILPTQNVALDNIEFLFVAASDHVTPVTAASGTAVTRSIDGGAFGAGTGSLAEVGNGIYQYDASQADMNGGIITFRFTGSGGTPGAPDDNFLTIVTGGGV